MLSMQGINHIQSTTYQYDQMDRLKTVSDINKVQATYTYDANGNRKDLKYLTGTFGANYTYNLSNLVTTIDNFNSGAAVTPDNLLSNVLPDYTYAYKSDGTQVSETDTQSGIAKTFSNDSINRLVNEAKAMNGHAPKGTASLTSSEEAPNLLADYSLAYTYDDYGNILTRVDGTKTTTYTYDKNNRITSEVEVDTNTTITKRFAYDGNGNTISERTEVYKKAAGQVGSSIATEAPGVKIYEYNLLNQQIKVTTGQGTTTYTYNASGLWDSKTTVSKATGTTTTKFYWDGTNIIGEVKNNVLTATYLYGAGLINREDKATGKKLYYFFNNHGDVTAMTNDTGEVVTVYDYNAHGEFSQRGLNVDNPFTYFSQYYDKETGSYYLRARYYNPNAMRFTQEDTYGGESNDPLSSNRYLYCAGNPVLFVDPSGHAGVALPTVIPTTGPVMLAPMDSSELGGFSQYLLDFVRDPLSASQRIPGLSLEETKKFYSDLEGFAKELQHFGNGLLTTAKDIYAYLNRSPGGTSINDETAKQLPGTSINLQTLRDFIKMYASRQLIGQNGTQVFSKTMWQNGKTERIDVENPDPGKRDGQIHYHDAKNIKWHYDMLRKVFYNKDTNELAPNSIQELLNNKAVKSAIEKAFNILGE